MLLLLLLLLLRARRGFIKGCAEHQANQSREKGERGVEERRGENSGHKQSARVRGEILGVSLPAGALYIPLIYLADRARAIRHDRICLLPPDLIRLAWTAPL